jgi:hypothetical protein
MFQKLFLSPSPAVLVFIVRFDRMTAPSTSTRRQNIRSDLVAIDKRLITSCRRDIQASRLDLLSKRKDLSQLCRRLWKNFRGACNARVIQTRNGLSGIPVRAVSMRALQPLLVGKRSNLLEE